MTSASPLQINDLFWTLQGEGLWTGRRALFVRLPFCNYNCPWCDTEYNSFQKISEDEFEKFCNQESARFAVITGGEPLAHKDLPRIIMLLKKMGFYIACETNGSFPVPEGIDFPTVSPKKYSQNKWPEYYIDHQTFERAKEFKYVVDSNFDFSILERHNVKTNKDVRLSLTPEYSTMTEQLPKIIAYIQKNPQWQLNLQTHKWIQIP